jgi:hypothetical protein
MKIPTSPISRRKYLSGGLPTSIVVLTFKKAPIPLLPEYTSHIDITQQATLDMPDFLYSILRIIRTNTVTKKRAN